MLNFLPSNLLLFISSFMLFLNTMFFGSLIFIGGLFKLIIPFRKLSLLLSRLNNFFYWAWATCNGGILKLISKIEWQIEGLEKLDKDSWYLIISNHLSAFDIAAQTYVLRNHIPMLKFFLKWELIYVPFMGLACWALDMPFMHRTNTKKLKKNPKLRGKDLESTRRSCEKFRFIPTSIINYVEGSRFTEEKRQRQNSPYRYLLKPKSGGIAFTISTIGSQFKSLLNITIIYPKAPKEVLSGVMKGKVNKVIMKIETLPIPEIDADRYFKDSHCRVEFQRWLNDLWKKKDQQIHQVLEEHQARNACPYDSSDQIRD